MTGGLCVCVCVHVVKRSLSNIFLVYITFYVARCGIHAPNFLALTATVEPVQLLTGIYGRTIKPQYVRVDYLLCGYRQQLFITNQR